MALSLLERVQAWLLRALMGALFGLFKVLSPRTCDRRKLPPVENPLLTVSAVQLARKIRRREVCGFGSSVNDLSASLDLLNRHSERFADWLLSNKL